MRIEHIAVYVSDLEGAKAFFEKYFGIGNKTFLADPEKKS